MYYVMESFWSLFVYFKSGGIIMYPLAAVSMLLWLFFVNRFVLFKGMSDKDISVEEARDYIKGMLVPDLEKYRGIRAKFVARFIKRITSDSSFNNRLLDEDVMFFVASLNKYLSFIAIMAKIAPLLGLLGTVIGMITTFEVISCFGTGNAKAMAAGISEALVTTQSGLLVAIPGLFMSNYLYRKSDRLKHRIASTAIYLRKYI